MKGRTYAQGESDLSDHAFERLQHWKKVYIKHRDDHLVGSTMKLDSQYWINKIQQLATALIAKYPDIQNDEELKAMVQGWIDKRGQSVTAIADRSLGEALKAAGVVMDTQHWLSMTGGIDYRATGLPEIIAPNPAIAGELDSQEARAI